MMHRLALFAGVICSLACTTFQMEIDGKQMSIDDVIMEAGDNGYLRRKWQHSGTMLVELDMLYKMTTYLDMLLIMEPGYGTENSGDTKGKPIIDKWTNHRIPYEISYMFTPRDRALISQAIADIHRYTCLRFAPATRSDRNKVRFDNDGGCSSYVGMIGGTQSINLAPGCRYKGVILHQLGHAIGFHHEQNRQDRNSYVYINSANIENGSEYNFMKYPTGHAEKHGVPYDYSSIMHSSGTFFTRNGQPTIIARDRRFQTSLGNGDGFSYKNIQLANAMYNCASANRCVEKSCGQGFQGPDCKCWCDSGSRNNPIKECDETDHTESTTTVQPSSPTTCKDYQRNCPSWASAGFCTGVYENYMRVNCQYSCNVCQRPTTALPSPPPPGPECKDMNRYCSFWASKGECLRRPSYMNKNCQRSCDSCRGMCPTKLPGGCIAGWTCKNTSECQSNEKCCYHKDCGQMQCMPAVHYGTCPTKLPGGCVADDPACSTDGDCEVDQKCCLHNGCMGGQLQCMTASLD